MRGEREREGREYKGEGARRERTRKVPGNNFCWREFGGIRRTDARSPLLSSLISCNYLLFILKKEIENDISYLMRHSSVVSLIEIFVIRYVLKKFCRLCRFNDLSHFLSFIEINMSFIFL